MDFQINQEEIAQKVTDEVLKEIEELNTPLTDEEIKKKINDKLDEIFKKYENEKYTLNHIKDEEDEEVIKNEFTDIEESSTGDDDKFNSLLESAKEDSDIEEENIENEELENNQENEPQNKKKFFEEFAELYKNELQNSINNFKSAFESFKLMNKTSIIEKILIFIFLAIPAAFGGLLTLFFILILLFLWQIHILLKVLLKFFERIESSLKDTIVKIKKKIDALKSSGGFFNRLIFSNALYSLIMFNGILYMLIKGMIFPLKSAMDIDKIVANFISKSVRAAAMGLRSPSELALTSLKNNALSSSNKTKTKDNTKDKNKLKLRSLLNSKQNLQKMRMNNKNAKKQFQIKAIKGKVANKIGKKLEAGREKLIKEKVNMLMEKLDMLNTQEIPSSNQLSNTEREKSSKNDLSSMIFGNVLGNIKDRILDATKDFKNPKNDFKNNGQNFKQDDVNRQKENLKNEILNNDARATQEGANMSKQTILGAIESQNTNNNNYQNTDSNSIVNINHQNIANIEKISKEQCLAYKTGEINVSDMVNNTLENIMNDTGPFTEDQKLDIALGLGQMMDSVDDKQSNQLLKEFKDSHPDATPIEIAKEDERLARSDLRKEIEQFEDRYGIKPNDLLGNKMIEKGIDRDATLTNEQLIEFTKEIVKEQTNLSEEQKLGMMKDFGEYAGAYLEKERTKEQIRETEREEKRIENQNKRTSRESSGMGIGI